MPQRTGSGEAELVFDVGPLGLWPNASHGHADALAVCIRVNGRFILADPGTGAYFHTKETRDAFRRSSAHNTVTIDDLDQADIYGTFKWVNPYMARLLRCVDDRDLFYATASHDGYERLRRPVTHERTVVSLPEGGWLVVDRLHGAGEHIVRQHFHFAPTVELTRASGDEVVAMDASAGSGIHLVHAAPPGHDVEIDSARTGRWSERYGAWTDSDVLRLSTHGKLPVMLATLLTPQYGSGTPPGGADGVPGLSVESLEHGSALLFCVSRAGSVRERVVINPESGMLALPGGCRSNAEFSYVRLDSDGRMDRVTIAGRGASLVGADVHVECDDHGSWQRS